MAGGEISMCICLAGVAAIIAVYGDRFDTNVGAGNGAAFLREFTESRSNRILTIVFWYIISFAMTWGPLPFIVASEVFPLDMRGKGMSVSFCINWVSHLIGGPYRIVADRPFSSSTSQLPKSLHP